MASVDIAIVGMACRFAGDAKSPEAFHEMLVRGRDAWSEVPSSRYNANAFQHRSRERPGTVVNIQSLAIRRTSSILLLVLTVSSGWQGRLFPRTGCVQVGCSILRLLGCGSPRY